MGEGQDIDQALCQLRKLVQEEYGRPWCKRRYGYHESKGVLGRKRKKMKKLRGGGPVHFQSGSLKLHIGYKELFERSGPEMAAGSVLCPVCRARYDEYLCAECGQNVCCSKIIPHGNVCESCLMRARAYRLPPFLLEPIAAEVKAGRTLSAIRLVRETLGWPLRDAIDLVGEIKTGRIESP